MTNSKVSSSFSIIEKLSILFYILVEINADLFAERWIYILSVILFLVSISFSKETKYSPNGYLAWGVLWTAMVVLSYTYTVSQSYTGMAILIVGARILIMYVFLSRLSDLEAIKQLMKLIIIASLINTLYMLTMVDLTLLGDERLGKGTLDESWNANSIGMELTFCVFFIFYLFKNHSIRYWIQPLYWVSAILFVIVILLTGSRKALFLLVLPIMLYYMLTSNSSNAIKRFTIVCIALVIAYLIVMTVDPIYNVLGVRVERLIESWGGDTDDGSIYSRRWLIDLGMRWFVERPLFGYGMNSFEPMCGQATGTYWYSHNNFVEILVGTGIVGLIVYYTLYVRLLWASYKHRYSNYAIGISIMIPVLISETGLVSYKTFIVQFAIMIVVAFMLIDKDTKWKKRKKVISRSV